MKKEDNTSNLVVVFYLLLIVTVALGIVLVTRNDAKVVEGINSVGVVYSNLDNFYELSVSPENFVGQKFIVEGEHLMGVRYCSNDYWTKHYLKDKNGHKVFFLPKDEDVFKLGKDYEVSGTFVKITNKFDVDCYLLIEDNNS